MDYSGLAALYDAVTSTAKRLEKTNILAGFIRTVPGKELGHVLQLVQGRVFPQWDPRELGFSAQLTVKALSKASGVSQDEVVRSWKELGDLGMTATALMGKGRQASLFQDKLTTWKVHSSLQKMASVEGGGAQSQKMAVVVDLLSQASPVEARYIIRTVLQDLRIGLGEGTVRDALVWAFEQSKLGFSYDAEKNDVTFVDGDRTSYDSAVQAYQEAYDFANDFSKVAEVAATEGIEGLRRIDLVPGTPVKVMLFQKASGMEDALKTVSVPAAVEYKYDGFRMQIHKNPEGISIFTRRLENVTAQFPDVVAVVGEKCKGESFIIDAEAVGIDKATKKYLPFQQISQRIRRKYDIAEVGEKFPVELDIFDVLFFDGTNLVHAPFSERRETLRRILPSDEPGRISLAAQTIVNDASEAESFYVDSLSKGNEGVMLKSLSAPYKPGSRVGYGVKVKPTLETLEVVVVGAEYGEGKRGDWLATFIIAVRDEDSGELLEIGRVGTGFKEKDEEGVSFRQMTELLLPIVTSEDGRGVKVKPRIVIEVDYEEIQKSPTYSSGFALRFPRFVRLREDRDVEDISGISDVEKYFSQQRGRG